MGGQPTEHGTTGLSLMTTRTFLGVVQDAVMGISIAGRVVNR